METTRIYNYSGIIGIDEVGRGPIAGPVTLGLVYVPWYQFQTLAMLTEGVKDSKQLSEKQRYKWLEKIIDWSDRNLLDYQVVSRDQKVIDQKGISTAIRQAINTGLKKLPRADHVCAVRLDGRLKAPQKFVHQTSIVKGDETEWIISLASIAAKITRDEYMCRQAKKFPGYGFEQHKGYGTKHHYQALQEHGACCLHRKSFLRSVDSDYS